MTEMKRHVDAPILIVARWSRLAAIEDIQNAAVALYKAQADLIAHGVAALLVPDTIEVEVHGVPAEVETGAIKVPLVGPPKGGA